MKNLLLILFLAINFIIQGQTPSFTQADEEINNYIFSGEWQQAKLLVEKNMGKSGSSQILFYESLYVLFIPLLF